MAYRSYDEAAASVAHILPSDRLVIARLDDGRHHFEYYACDIDDVPDGFAGIAWGEPRASDVELLVFERAIRKDCSCIVINWRWFTIAMMHYEPPAGPDTAGDPDLFIVMGKASDQDISEALAEAVVEFLNRERPQGKPQITDETKVCAEAYLKLVRSGTLDDGSKASIKSVAQQLVKQLRSKDAK